MYLAAAIIALLIGPLFYGLLVRYGRLQRALEIGATAVATIMALFFLPHAYEHGGPMILLMAALGVVGPTLLERGMRQGVAQVHVLTVVLTAAGLALHAMADGAAIVAATPDQAGLALIGGIVLHRLPIGLAIWWLVTTGFGTTAAISVIGLMALSTVAGFLIGSEFLPLASSEQLAWFTAFVAGTILHLTFHRLPLFGGHDHSHDHDHQH